MVNESHDSPPGDPSPPAPSVEAGGASVEEATASALSQLGVSAEEAVVEVIARGGGRAVAGEFLSSNQARVRVSALDAHTLRGRALLVALLEEMEIPARVSVRRGSSPRIGETEAPLILEVSGDDLGLLIGWRGETLRALQTTLNLMMGEDESAGRRLILDVERYRARREEQVRELAQRLAERVKSSGERYTLDPMHAYERRIIHLTLQDDPAVRTESLGRDPARRVIIHPTGPAQVSAAGERPQGGRGRW